MQISQDLPQFENICALVAVLSSKDARFYSASDSHIEELEEFHIKEPDYSKDWTVRGSRAKKNATQINSSYGSNDSSLLTDFLHHCATHFGNISKKINVSQTYIFCPSYMDRRVRDVLPDKIHRTVVAVYKGNYVKHHPFELLEMLTIEADKLKDISHGEGEDLTKY